MNERGGFIQVWWEALVHPELAGKLLAGPGAQPGFDRWLVVSVAALYAFYGVTMGLFHSLRAGLISGIKLPFLFLLTLAVCLAPLYVLNCLFGPRLGLRQCLRLLLVAISANAAALASYGPFSLFFTLTAFERNYVFLVMMHVVVFALAGGASLAVIGLLFRAAAAELGEQLRPAFLGSWGILYAFVGCQMAWTLRPWVGFRGIEYVWIRQIEGSFIESVWHMTRSFLR